MKHHLLLFLVLSSKVLVAQKNNSSEFLRAKTEGLLIGSLIGDALGGPIEFQGHDQIQATPNPPKRWTDTIELLDQKAIREAGNRIYLREYKFLRPVPEPYGHWGVNAPPGTVTDDSRHKIILMNMLKKAVQKKNLILTDKILAQTYLDWSASNTIRNHAGYDTLCAQWLGESYKAIHWLQGNRELGKAYPLERLWNALPTCYGQMTLPPLAAIYPGDPEQAYRAAYAVAYFDNGFARDMNAALVAGLSVALASDSKMQSAEQIWQNIFNAMRTTDPFAYQQVPWSERAVERWLNVSIQFAKESGGSPAKLFALLDKEFQNTIKWEAQVPFVVIFSAILICQYDPLAAMQLSIEWGWDHDSYAQLLGAFVGAIYGPEIFSDSDRSSVKQRLVLDYDEDIDNWVTLLSELRERPSKRKLFTH
jgi:ADP-ribosylglycohydrolase